MPPPVFEPNEVNHSIATINRAFNCFGSGESIIEEARAIAATGSLAILDGGCGSGIALVELKHQAPLGLSIALSDIVAVGVDIADYRQYITENVQARNQTYDGFIDFRQGNLKTIELEPNFYDLGYSFEVFIHDDDFPAILANVLPSLKPGGKYFCNTELRQTEQFESTRQQYGTLGWTILSQTVTEQFCDHTATRVFHKFIKPK